MTYIKNKSIKASEILRDECCGHCYNTLDGKQNVIAMVKKLERDNEIQLNALKKIQSLPTSRLDELSAIAYCARRECCL